MFVINETRMAAHEPASHTNQSQFTYRVPFVFELMLTFRSPYRSRFDCFHAMLLLSVVLFCFVSFYLIKYHFVICVARFKLAIRVLPFLFYFFFISFKKLAFFHFSLSYFLHRRWFQMQFYWGISIFFFFFNLVWWFLLFFYFLKRKRKIALLSTR